MLPGMTLVPATRGPIDFSYLTSDSSASDLSTYTFTGLSFGTADTDRRIIAVVTVLANVAVPQSISSVTIGGVSATAVATKTLTNRVIAIYIASVPTTTSGDVVVSCSALSVRAAVALWRAVNLSSATAAATNTGTTSSDLNVQTGDIIVVGAQDNSTATMAPTGYTERVDIAYDGNRFEAGDHTAVANETPRAISCATPTVMVSASWR